MGSRFYTKYKNESPELRHLGHFYAYSEGYLMSFEPLHCPLHEIIHCKALCIILSCSPFHLHKLSKQNMVCRLITTEKEGEQM